MRAIYRKILTYPHHISSRHTPMSADSRAAKFSSFKALDGHEDKIVEAGRETERKRILTEEERDKLNAKLYALLDRQYEQVRLWVRYFEPDTKKDGGRYVNYEGTFKYFREDTRCYVFTDGFELPVGKSVEVRYE